MGITLFFPLCFGTCYKGAINFPVDKKLKELAEGPKKFGAGEGERAGGMLLKK
jgi:hypothetical protein